MIYEVIWPLLACMFTTLVYVHTQSPIAGLARHTHQRRSCDHHGSWVYSYQKNLD